MVHKLRVVRRAVSARQDGTGRLIGAVGVLQKAVDARSSLMDMRATAATRDHDAPSEGAMSLQTAMTNNQLRELVRLQHSELQMLAAELDRLQRRSFPAFVVNPRLPADVRPYTADREAMAAAAAASAAAALMAGEE